MPDSVACARRLLNEASVYLLAAFGAAAALAIKLPLGILVGPMLVLSLASQRWPRLAVSPPVYALGLVVIGVSLGQYFTPEVIATWRAIGGTLALNALMTLAGLGLGYWFLTRVLRYDPATAAFSGLPGGILTVMEVSRESDADAGKVLFFQVFRIVIGATTIPLAYALAGFDVPTTGVRAAVSATDPTWRDALLLGVGAIVLAMLGRRLRFPSAEISLPLIWSAILYATGMVSMALPLWLPVLGFVVVGAAVGTMLPRLDLPTLARLSLHTVLVFILFMVLTIIAALLAQPILELDFATGVLTFSPASLTEMIAVAVALSLDPALVAANNLFRMIFCSVLAPLLLIWLRRQGHGRARQM